MNTSTKISVHELRPGKSDKEQVPLNEREWVVGYARVSSTRQGSEKGFGLETQKKAIMDYCKSHSLAVSEIFTDILPGTEASLEERKDFWLMLERCKKAGIKKVVVFDVNRLFRDPATCVLVKKAFFALSLDIKSISQPQYSIYTDHDPSEFLVNSLMDALASYDRLQIVSKLKAGRAEKAKQGRYAGGGISTGVTVLNREIVVDEVELEIVKFIFRLKKRGFSPYRIAKILNEKGVKSKRSRSWYPTGIKRILKNRLYNGYLKSGKNFYKSQLGKLI